MESIIPQLFDLEDKDNWKSYLDEEGYVVIKNVLNDDDYNNALSTFKKEWKTICPDFDFDNTDTWTEGNCVPLHSGWYYGMINGCGFGQSEFQWMLRTNSNILDIWKTVHDTNELVVSFDGMSVFLSPSQEGIMYHTDQHPSDTLYSVQGSYNFFPVDVLDAGFVVVPKSHKTFTSNHPETYNFICVDDEDEHLLNAKHLMIPKNCFVLWNSKTIHSSIGMDIKKNIEFNRLTSYMCYFPKALRSEDAKLQRIQGYLDADNCSHYAIHHQRKPNRNNEKKLVPKLNEDGTIPANIMELI